MSNPGYLLVTMEPPPTLEDEFNDWYDTEHVPERRAVPGFESAVRFVCIDGWPRYLAFYDLDSAAVLTSKAYLAISGDRFSPWSKRILSRVRGLLRASGDQILACTMPIGTAARLLLVRFRNVGNEAGKEIVGRSRSAFEGMPGVRQLRVLSFPHDATSDFIVMVESSAPAAPLKASFTSFGTLQAAIDLVNEYIPYQGGRLPL